MKVQIVLPLILTVALASDCSSHSKTSCSLDDDSVGLLQQKISVHDMEEEGTGTGTELEEIPQWFAQTDECFVEYCQTWKDLREFFCCGSLPKENGYCTEDPGNPNICTDSMASQCGKHLAENLQDPLKRLSGSRRYLYSTKCGGYKVTVSSTCETCGEFKRITMEEGIKAWSDRSYYRYRYIPQELIGSTMFQGCHKCFPTGTVFTVAGIPPGKKVCAWGERAHLYRHGRFPKTLPEQGWTQVANESMVWEFSPTWQIAMDVFCKSISAGGTITLPATQGNVFVGGFALEADCDWQCYLDRYPNLKEVVGTDIGAAKQHWELYGKDEGRICTCPPADCDWDCYLQRYPDVAAVVGIDNTLGAQIHYEKHGASEGRDCSCTGSLWSTKAETTLDDT